MEHTEEYIKRNADVLTDGSINEWYFVSQNIDLTKTSNDFFQRFKHNINWVWILENKTITTKFAQKFHKEIGSKRWYKNGKLHRENGPAVIWPDDRKAWCKDGQFHREDGPALICIDGTKQWFEYGILLKEKKHNGEISFYK